MAINDRKYLVNINYVLDTLLNISLLNFITNVQLDHTRFTDRNTSPSREQAACLMFIDHKWFKGSSPMPEPAPPRVPLLSPPPLTTALRKDFISLHFSQWPTNIRHHMLPSYNRTSKMCLGLSFKIVLLQVSLSYLCIFFFFLKEEIGLLYSRHCSSHLILSSK